MAAATSASVIGVSSDVHADVPRSPERLSLSRSTPSRASSRQTRRIASGPSATQQKVGVSWYGRWSRLLSPSPPVTVISGPLASRRGPGKRPASISRLTTTSRRGLAAAAESALV